MSIDQGPSSAGNTTLKLMSTISGERTDKVTFSAPGFKPYEPPIEQRDGIVIKTLTVTFQVSNTQNISAPDAEDASPTFNPVINDSDYERMTANKSNRKYTYTYTNIRLPSNTDITIKFSWQGILGTYTYSATVKTDDLNTEGDTITLSE